MHPLPHIPLTALRSPGEITDIPAPPALRQRLSALGMVTGARVTPLYRNASLCAYDVAGTAVALRKTVTDRIFCSEVEV